MGEVVPGAVAAGSGQEGGGHKHGAAAALPRTCRAPVQRIPQQACMRLDRHSLPCCLMQEPAASGRAAAAPTSLNTSWKMFCRSEGWRCRPFSRPSTVAWMTSSDIWRSGGSRPATLMPPAAESMRRGLGSPRAPAAVEDESTLLARPASSSASLTTLGFCKEGVGGRQLGAGGAGGRAVGPAGCASAWLPAGAHLQLRRLQNDV